MLNRTGLGAFVAALLVGGGCGDSTGDLNRDMLRSVSRAQVERREIRPAERDALVAELRDTAAQQRGRVVAETGSRFGLDEVANRLAAMPLPAPPNRGRLLDPDARALAELVEEMDAAGNGEGERAGSNAEDAWFGSTAPSVDDEAPLELGCSDPDPMVESPGRLPAAQWESDGLRGPRGAEVVFRSDPSPLTSLGEIASVTGEPMSEDAARIAASAHMLDNVARSYPWEQAEEIVAEHVARCRPERGCDFRNGLSLDPSIVHDLREAGRL